MCWAQVKPCPRARAHTLDPDGERVAWSGTILASGCLDVTKMPQNTEQDQWIEVFGLGHKRFGHKQNATHMFLPEYHQYRTQVSLRGRARGEVTLGHGCWLHSGHGFERVDNPCQPVQSVVTWSSPEVFGLLSSEQNQSPSHQFSGFFSLREPGVLSFRS